MSAIYMKSESIPLTLTKKKQVWALCAEPNFKAFFSCHDKNEKKKKKKKYGCEAAKR